MMETQHNSDRDSIKLAAKKNKNKQTDATLLLTRVPNCSQESFSTLPSRPEFSLNPVILRIYIFGIPHPVLAPILLSNPECQP